MDVKKKLKMFANHNYNVMLIGDHGVGKTTVVKEVLEDDMGLNYLYFSAPTLDPYINLIGVPAPDKETGQLKFYRTDELEKCEAMFFDELNRAHPRTLNAILEAIQLRSINGRKLPNLRFVWAAINPPDGNYQVEDLDPALVDRFHMYIKMPASIDIKYMSTKMGKEVAQALAEFWNEDLNDEQRHFLTPRRMEYIGTMFENNVPWRDAIPEGQPIPLNALQEKLDALTKKAKRRKTYRVTKDFILKNKDDLPNLFKETPGMNIKVAEVLKTKCFIKDLFTMKDVVEGLPKELIKNVSSGRLPIFFIQLKKEFDDAKVDTAKHYPKIHSCFKFDES